MNFPKQAIETIIAYLTGAQPAPGVGDVIKAVLEVLEWVRWLVFESGFNFAMTSALAPTTNLDGATVLALQDLLKQQQSGVQAANFIVPTWLIPILLELLKRLW